ncbi:MAG: glycosyltransferase [Clostridia bacterium]|nr:glycosyltransferase [Clostridia bacterium]
MKISFLDDEPEIFPLQYGGKARTIVNLAKEFIKLPEVDKVTILSRSIVCDKAEFDQDGIHYVVLNDNNIMSRIAFEINDADILNIHCCSFTFPVILGKAKKFYFLHDVLLATAEKGSHLDKALGGQFDAIIAPSEFAKSVYEENKKIINGNTKCYVIPRHINTKTFCGISKEEIMQDEKAPALVKDIINKYEYILFFPSRPIEEKGGKYLKELSTELGKKFNNYCIVGPFGNDDVPSKSCINTDWIKSNKLKYYYSIADVTLNFSSLPESFSQICLESAYCGTPVVSFKSGNIPTLSKQIDSIILVDKTIDSILNGINNAIVMKNDLERIEQTKEKIIENFGSKKIINEYLSLYQKYMEGLDEE